METAQGSQPFVKDNNLFSDDAAGQRLFVQQQFRDFFGREADAGGLAYWQAELAAGRQTRASMAEAFLTAIEYQNAVAAVIRLYLAAYMRIPDAAGLDYWINAYRNGTPLADIAQAFATAPEFIARYGALTNRNYVNRLYENVLQRPADSGGSDFWTAQLDLGGKPRQRADKFQRERRIPRRQRTQRLCGGHVSRVAASRSGCGRL